MGKCKKKVQDVQGIHLHTQFLVVYATEHWIKYQFIDCFFKSYNVHAPLEIPTI